MLSDDNGPHHLYKALGEKLSQAVSVDRSDLEDASVFNIYITAVPGASIAAIDERISGALTRFAREGPAAVEVERTRNKLESNRLGDLESISGVASTMQYVHQVYGSIDRWHDFSQRYRSVTVNDIRATVARWLVTPSHLTIDVLPMTAVRGETPAPDRKTPPPFQPEKPYTAPEVQTATLANGLQILVLERHDLPKVAVRLQFRAGTIQSPPSKPALRALAAASARGSATKKEVEFNSALADLGTSLAGDADVSTQDFRFDVLRKNLDPAFRIFADGLLHTNYPDWAAQALKKDLLGDMEKPDLGLNDFIPPVLAAAFGANHSLGAGFGTPDSLRSITTTDIREFHDRYWKPDIAALIFAGDITLKDAVALADNSLGSWSGTTPPVSEMPPPAPKHDRVVYVDRPGLTQTMVVQVLPAIPRDHPDYPALLLADSIYGGMSSSRIWENIRQHQGIAYYAHSRLNYYPSAGLWLIFSPVESDKTAIAMHEFEAELAAFGRSKPITQTELDQARTGFIRSLPERFETLASAAGTIASTWAWGLPLTDMKTFPQRLTAVTLDEVNAVARKYARPDQGFFVLVGDRQKIEPQLH